MASKDFRDLYIKYPGHPKYELNVIVEDDPISVIIQKYEVLLFTNRGELLGDPNFGCDLERYLFQTKVSANYVKDQIIKQINSYIPELSTMNFTLDVTFTKDIDTYQEAMIIFFSLADFEVYARIGQSLNNAF